MAHEGKEILIDWLRDAHAMEQMSESILEKQVKRTKSYPHVQEKIREHLETTKRQAERLERVIKKLDGGTSRMKEGMGKMIGNLGALVNSASEDEVVKNGIGDFAVEQYEIACYKSLIAAADHLRFPEVKQVCEEILHEEQEMAAWLDANIGDVTSSFLDRKQNGQQAKR